MISAHSVPKVLITQITPTHLAEAIEKGELSRGIAMCGSANGITMTLNKHQGIRAAICWEPEIAALARQHNDANVCSMPARFIDNDTALKVVDIFLNTPFEGDAINVALTRFLLPLTWPPKRNRRRKNPSRNHRNTNSRQTGDNSIKKPSEIIRKVFY